MRSVWAGVAAGALVILAPLGARASCVAITESQATAKADVVFEGIAEPGQADARGALISPARFSVLKYRKGTGPSVLSVAIDAADNGVVRSGEVWVIYATGSTGGTLQTSTCDGTYLASGPKPFVTETPTPSPTPHPSASVAARPAAPAEPWPWGISTAAGVAGVAIVMGIGWAVARLTVGTR